LKQGAGCHQDYIIIIIYYIYNIYISQYIYIYASSILYELYIYIIIIIYNILQLTC